MNIVSFGTKGDLVDQMLADLRKGSPFYDAFVFPGQTKSELILCSECDPEQRPMIAPLTELIRNDAALKWNDVAVFQRSTNSAYDGEIYTVPIDGGRLTRTFLKASEIWHAKFGCNNNINCWFYLLDFHYMFYRKDVLEKFGLDVPQTWWVEVLKLPKKAANFGDWLKQGIEK